MARNGLGRQELARHGLTRTGLMEEVLPAGLRALSEVIAPLSQGRSARSRVDRADALFLLRWMKSPLRIGAVAPSSRYLAKAMARQIMRRSRGPVVELGGGTGSITQALLDMGVPAHDLVVVERDLELASVLERRFPAIRLVRGDATALRPLLADLGITRVAAVVSGLPLLSMPKEVQRQIVDASFGLLGRAGVMVQFTYGLTSPIPHAEFGLRGWRSDRVWRNVPPASIWRFRLGRGQPG